eukprot:7839337-Alexandrium_andersonii.AAC.1
MNPLRAPTSTRGFGDPAGPAEVSSSAIVRTASVTQSGAEGAARRSSTTRWLPSTVSAGAPPL